MVSDLNISLRNIAVRYLKIFPTLQKKFNLEI